MNVNHLVALALVLLVVVAGCSTVDSPTESQSPTHTEPSPTPPATGTPTVTSTAVVKTPPPTATAIPTETWTPPATPRDPENKLQDRISNVEFINTKKAPSGEGYTAFDIQVTANTSMEDVDPTPSVEGEPYFAITINDKIVVREDVYFRESGTFTLTVMPRALDQFDSGTVDNGVYNGNLPKPELSTNLTRVPLTLV